MSRGILIRFQEEFHDGFKNLSRIFHKTFKGPPRVFEGSFKNFFKVFQRSLKLLCGCFKVVLFFKVYCCMSLIAATRAEGGLVYFEL